MKNLILTCALLLWGVSMALAQMPQEGRRTMSLGTNNSFAILIDGLDAKEVEKQWDEFLKINKAPKPRKDRKSGEIFTDDASLPAISANTIDLYATVNEKDKTSAEIVIWFDLGGAYLSSMDHADRIEALQKWLGEFTLQTRVRKVELELEAEEKKLGDMNKEFAKLAKEQESLEKTIADAEKKIQEAKKGLEVNASAQQNAKSGIEEQQKVVDKVKDKLKRVQ